MRQHFKDLMSLVAEIRLKVKEGTHKTLGKVRVYEIVTIPVFVTLVIEPFGSLTWVETDRCLKVLIWTP
jgi:hypothetical protein